MTKQEFLNELKNMLETDQEITESTLLEDLDEWDSLAMMSLATFFDENFSIKTKMDQMNKFKTVSDIIAFLGDHIE